MTKKHYTVGQINGYIKNLINSDYLLGDVYVKGEVSNVKYHSSGHIYFSLKDETGVIAAVMFRGSVQTGLDFKLENGQMVVAHGGINVYERNGSYNLNVKDITLDGIGNLYEKYEELKQKLYEQGLFEFDTKKDIPAYPKKVGIVTAKTGAAIQDIRNIAKRRNPYVELILYPAKVQGEGAAEDIAHGIEVLDKMGLDTIIIGRGGGSLEDLWAFNEEITVRAIYNAKTPIISGTGHEIDNTLADYAADLRAPTPSAACELAIPDIMSTINQVQAFGDRYKLLLRRKLDSYNEKVLSFDRHLRLLNPKQKLENQQIYLDRLSDEMADAVKKKFDDRREAVDTAAFDLHLFMTAKYEKRRNSFMLLAERLNGLSPLAKLINGYGYMSSNEKPVKSTSDVKPDDEINITLHDGIIAATVTNVSKKGDI